jgi:hypothetical protein
MKDWNFEEGEGKWKITDSFSTIASHTLSTKNLTLEIA